VITIAQWKENGKLMDIISKTVVTLQWKVAIRAAGQMARFDLLSISFVSSHFLMPNYDNSNINNKKLMKRVLTCLTWCGGDGEFSAKGIYGHNNPHMRNCDNSKLMERERRLSPPLPHMAGTAWWWRNFCKRYIYYMGTTTHVKNHSCMYLTSSVVVAVLATELIWHFAFKGKQTTSTSSKGHTYFSLYTFLMTKNHKGFLASYATNLN
jgi:hypothetical protein